MEFNEITKMIAVFAVPVLFAITLHEAAHGYVARHFGDTTAFKLGRISLNPARHIDLVGTVFLPLVTLFATGGRIMFGWAKPVPVNFHALRHPKRDMLWVALAGPTANLAMALGWAAVLKMGALSGLAQGDFLIQVPLAGVEVNLVFMALNLLPILPLDGGRVVVSLLPGPLAGSFARLEPFGLPILLGLVVISSYGYNVLGMFLDPVMGASRSVIATLFQLHPI
ncbi:MAG: site-2 protease family protein [Betaproteobacteria bacterium]|nr:MAG: site-2 protease family protein [Betaproteobacteria bacterium]TMH91986.1 MAG: site-2 protease family protein [Betaproteobacteria bacterium]